MDGYRTGALSRYEVQRLLGHDSRWETEAWLGERGVDVSYSSDDLEEDRKTLRRVLAGN
jgi:predicted HTH domain antitoxin